MAYDQGQRSRMDRDRRWATPRELGQVSVYNCNIIGYDLDLDDLMTQIHQGTN